MLNEILSTDIYRFFIIFTRLGATLMIMPALGGAMVPARIRLLVGLAIAFLLLPTLAAKIPPMPSQMGQLVLLILGEATVGFFMGSLIQILITAVHLAGSFIGFQTGLTNAFSFDAIAQQQGQLLSAFLVNMAMAVIFITDLHHLMLRAMVDSYGVFAPGAPLPLGDLIETLGKMLAESFAIGIKISAPLMVFGMVFYAGLGLLSRLVPQMQVFFIAMPVQVLVGLWMLMVALPVMMFLFLRFFEAGLVPYLSQG